MEKSLLITIIIIVGVLLFAGIVLMTSPEKQGPTVNIKGESSIDVFPDIIKVHLTMISNTTEEKNTDLYIEELTAKFVAKGFRPDEIQITNLNIVPFTYYGSDYGSAPEDWIDRNISALKLVKVYRITNNLIAKFPSSEIEKIGKALSVGVENGATSIQVSYELSKDKENEYKAESLEKASEDVRKKAESLAKGLGKKVGKLIFVSSDQFNYIPPPIYLKEFYGSSAAADIQTAKSEVSKIQMSEQKITSTINAVFELK